MEQDDAVPDDNEYEGNIQENAEEIPVDGFLEPTDNVEPADEPVVPLVPEPGRLNEENVENSTALVPETSVDSSNVQDTGNSSNPEPVPAPPDNLTEEVAESNAEAVPNQADTQELSPESAEEFETVTDPIVIMETSTPEKCSAEGSNAEVAVDNNPDVKIGENNDNSLPSTSVAEPETANEGTEDVESICKDCNVPGTIKRYRRQGGRIRKGQQVHWTCKYKCPQCSEFFGDEWQFDSKLQRYKKIIPGSQGRPMPCHSENGTFLKERITECKGNDGCDMSNAEDIDLAADAPSNNSTLVEENMVATTSTQSSSERPTGRGGRRQKTTRKNTRQSGADKETEEKIAQEVAPEASINVDIEEQPIIETVIVDKKKPGRPPAKSRKRTAESEAKLCYEPPRKTIQNPAEEELKEEEIRAARSKAIIEAVLSKLEIGPVCSDEASTSSGSVESYKDRALSRSMKTFGIMKYTVDRLKTENTRMTATLKNINHKFGEHARASRLQANGISALVDSLNKELKFFRDECVSEARATNALYKKQQAEFEVKYGYRVMERDIVQSNLDNLQLKFDRAKMQMKEMADDLARQENEIREFEKLKETAEQGKYMRCQTCVANEVLLEKLRPELTALRKEKTDWDKKYKQMEKEATAAKERLKVVEAELKKQTFISKSYEALDKQMRAKEQEKQPVKPTPKANEEEKSDEKKEKKDDPKIPSFSDMVDPEILAQASKIGSSLPPMFRAPKKEPVTGSVAITPESPHFDSAHHSRGHPGQSPAHHRPNHHRPPHKSHTSKYTSQPPPRPSNNTPTFLCHQPNAHLPKANVPTSSKQPSPWQRPPDSSRSNGTPRPGQQPERRMDWTAYLSQKRNNN